MWCVWSRNHTFKKPMKLSSCSLRWRHNGCDSVSNHQPRECLLRRLIRRTSKKTSKLRVTGLCTGNSPETGEFPAQMASNAENVSIWWRHHVTACVPTYNSSCCTLCIEYTHTVETLYNTVNFCWNTHKRHSIARPKGRGMGCLLWVQRATYCVDLSKLSSIKYLL